MQSKNAFQAAFCLLITLGYLLLGAHTPLRADDDDPDGDPLVIHGPDTVYNGFCPPDAKSVPPYTYTATGGDGNYTFSVDDEGTASIENTNNTGILHPLETGTVNVKVTDGTGAEADMDVEIKPPEDPCQNHFFLSVDESAGPRYRKVALNGLPMPDEKPQAQDETDQEKEETYVDAFNLNLRHSTTDVFVPLVGGELSLSVRRNFQPEIWNDRAGLWAESRIDEPFGVNWSTGLIPHIQFVVQTVPANNSPCPAGRPPADYAYVTDEGGSVHRFLIAYLSGSGGSSLKFFPLPSGRQEQDEFLCTLTNTASGSYTFTRKFGTTLAFQAAPALTSAAQPADNFNPGNGASVQYSYARVSLLTDRYQNGLQYTYGSGSTLIPDRISSLNANGVADGRSLVITHDNSHISAIQDPNGNQTSYTYTTQTVQSAGGAHSITSLTQVTRAVSQPEHTSIGYTYELTSEEDSTPRETTDPLNHYYQSALASITDGNSHVTSFTYKPDQSRYDFDSRLNQGYYCVTGNPRYVSTAQLPAVLEDGASSPAAPTTTFINHSLVYVTYPPPATAGQPSVPTMNGQRATEIVDATGSSHRYYTYTAPQFISLTEFEDDLYHSSDPRQDPLMIVYGTMTLRTHYGQEVFQTDLSAGMALVSTTDLSGNTTTFAHTDQWSATAAYPWLNPSPAFPIAYYSDPNSQTDANHNTKYFHYDPKWRVMDRVFDEAGRLTVYAIAQNTGLRLSEDIFPAGAASNINSAPPSSASSQHTDFVYGSTAFPAFMTSKTVTTRSGDPSWSQNLVTQYAPDTQGHVASETVDPGGLALTTSYTYDNNGNKKSATDPRQNATQFVYDHLNRLIEVDYPGPTARKTFIYDANSNKLGETDENGHATLFVYDALNRVTDTGRDMNGDGSLSRSGTNADLVTSSTYNAVNSKMSVTDPNGNKTTMVYDGIQRLVYKEEPYNYETTYSYSGANSGGDVFNNSSFKPTSLVDPRGYTTTFTYDNLYRETARSTQYNLSPAAFANTSTVYDAVGNPYQFTDARGNVTLKTFDALNRVTQTTYAYNSPDQAKEQVFYTGAGLEWKLVDGNNNTTTKQSDNAGRVVLVTQPSVDNGAGTGTNQAPTTQTAYDADGNVKSIINPRGYQTDYAYDERNRRTTVTEPAVTDPVDGNSKRPVTTTGHDLVGNVTSVKTALDADQSGAHTTTTLYDVANRPYQITAPAVPVLMAGSTTITNSAPVSKKTYDFNGNVLTATDADNNVTHNVYDALNRLTSTTDAANDPVVYGYDAAGNRTSVKDGTNPATTYNYDGLNRNTAYIDAAHQETDYTYDGAVKTDRMDPLRQHTQYTYDGRLRLKTITHVNRSVDDRTCAYDSDGNLLTVKESAKGGAADVAYTYDALNRAATETSGGLTHQYFYDPAGNRTIARYSVNATPAGRILTSSYDGLNRLGSLVEAARTTGYTYDLEGNVLIKTLNDGEKVTTTYDALHRAAGIQGVNSSGGSLYSYVYNYDAVGNVRRSAETYASLSGQTIAMSYDQANRLQEEDTTASGGATTQVTYSYDTSHNRKTKKVGAATTTYAYNSLNQFTGWSNPSAPAGTVGSVSYGYDLDGNRISRTPSSGTASAYSYDFDNRLVGVTQGASTASVYVYDYRTRRVTRTENGTGTQVVFSGGTSVSEYAATNSGASTGVAPKVEFVRGGDWGGGVGGILYSLHPGSGTASPSSGTSSTHVNATLPARLLTVAFNHYNRRGDVVAETNGSAVVSYQATYEAFGTRPAEYGTDSDRQRANTKEEDPTGLLNEGMRYRDLETGVFMTRDPAGMVDGPNLYSYVQQNPWTMFDPEGLEGYFPRTQYERDHGTPPDIALLKAAGAWAGDHPRTMGGIKAAGSALEMAAGVAGTLAPTGVTQVLGGAAVAHGGDGFQAGVRQAWNGTPTETFTQQAIAGIATKSGANPATAQTIGAVGDGLLGFGLTLGVSVTTPVKSAAVVSLEARETADTITVLHGTTSNRAPSLIANGPDAAFRDAGDSFPAGGFSVATPHGSEVAGVGGTAQDYARATAAAYGGDPVVVSMRMPRSVYSKGAGDMTEMRFEPGSGLEDVQKAWRQMDKHVTPLPKANPVDSGTSN